MNSVGPEDQLMSNVTLDSSSPTSTESKQRLNASALDVLFSRVFSTRKRVIFPVNSIAFNTDDLTPAFFCVHSLSGAGVTDFRDLAELMPMVRFYGIQAPLEKMQQDDFGGSVCSIAQYYADALAGFQPTGPFFLGGWSAGAIISLEIAQNLIARGREVHLLVAIDAAPENVVAGLRPWHPLYLVRLAGNVPGWIRHENLLTRRTLQSLGWRTLNTAAAFANTRIFRRRRKQTADRHAVGGFMELDLFPPAQQMFMKRLYDALFDYKPKKYSGKVVVYEAKTKPLLRLPQIAEIWRTLNPLASIVSVSGTHLSILREGPVRILAQDLQRRIVETHRRNEPGLHDATASAPQAVMDDRNAVVPRAPAIPGLLDTVIGLYKSRVHRPRRGADADRFQVRGLTSLGGAGRA